MWELPSPDTVDCASDIDIALTKVDGTQVYAISGAERAELLALYDLYDHTLGRPDPALVGPLLHSDLRSALRDGYDLTQKGKRLERIRNALMVGVDRCPFCGIGAVTDLDHHLAKSAYKALSIYRRNLVPCCHTCNRLKDAAPPFAHAYFGELPRDERFFVASATIVAGGLIVNFRVVQTPQVSNEVFQLVREHVEALRLNARYMAEINEYLASLRHSIDIAYGPSEDAAAVQLLLLGTREKYERHAGVNHWKVALLQALADCPAFCAGGFRVALDLN